MLHILNLYKQNSFSTPETTHLIYIFSGFRGGCFSNDCRFSSFYSVECVLFVPTFRRHVLPPPSG